MDACFSSRNDKVVIEPFRLEDPCVVYRARRGVSRIIPGLGRGRAGRNGRRGLLSHPSFLPMCRALMALVLFPGVDVALVVAAVVVAVVVVVVVAAAENVCFLTRGTPSATQTSTL